jgi:hypothetical protein
VFEVKAIPQKPYGPSNSTGYVGIYMHRPKNRSHRWIARVTIDGKRQQVPGRYDSAKEAHDARVAFIAKHAIVAQRKPRSVRPTVEVA